VKSRQILSLPTKRVANNTLNFNLSLYNMATKKPKPKAPVKSKPRKTSGLAAFLASKGLGPESISNMLQKSPSKDPDKPHQYIPRTGMVQQADLLYLPWDRIGRKTYKYLLVVVDIANSSMDAEPLTGRTQKDIIAAFKRIYRRKFIKYPQIMMSTDPGSEFGNETRSYFQQKGTVLKHGRPGRSRQQAFAESKNGIIGRAVSLKQDNNEESTGERDRSWVQFVKELVVYLNRPEYLNKLYKPSENPKEPDQPVCSKNKQGTVNSCEMLPKGTKVRVISDRPKDAQGNILYGKKHRAGDRRWEPEIREIVQTVLKPKNPPLYLVSGIDGTAYTKAQLQVVKGGTTKMLSKKAQDVFNVEKIVGKKKINGRVHYRIKWSGYSSKDNSWEPRAQLIADGQGPRIKQWESANK